jgi:hypothetical protein
LWDGDFAIDLKSDSVFVPGADDLVSGISGYASPFKLDRIG